MVGRGDANNPDYSNQLSGEEAQLKYSMRQETPSSDQLQLIASQQN